MAVRHLTFGSALCAAAVFVACGGSPRFVPPERTVYLPIPLKADADSPLTYVVKANSAVDHAAPFVTGTSVTQAANAEISEIVVAEDRLRISGGLDQARIAAGTDEVTHLIVDAQVEKVYVVRDIQYNASSKCCEDGEPTDSCVGGYIESVLVGTGTVTYAKLKGTEEGQAAEVSQGEMASRTTLDTIKIRPFQSSYFAFTAASAARACEFSQ